MHSVQHPATGGQFSSSIPQPSSLQWSNPAERTRWLRALREQTLDALATGDDATRAPRRRLFSRHEARRRLRVAELALNRLLDAAERGLGPDEEAAKL